MPYRNKKGEIEVTEDDLKRRELALKDRHRWQKYAPPSADVTPKQRKQLVVSMACEGGGLDIFKVSGPKGEARYSYLGDSISMDANDHEDWIEWQSKTFGKLSEALDASDVAKWLRGFSVCELDPNYREELLEWAREKWRTFVPDHFKQLPWGDNMTPEFWVDGSKGGNIWRQKRRKV